MNRMTGLCLLNTMLMICGQMLFKIGSREMKLGSLTEIIKAMLTPAVIAALCLYAGTTVLWLYILSHMNLSEAYPIQALAFPVVLILSALLFRETIPVNRWLGVGIIFVGVYIAVYK